MKESSNLKIKKTEEDPRGFVYSGDFNNRKFIILSFKKGAPRGGHYHNMKTVHFVFSGSLELKLKDIEKNKEEKRIVKSGDTIIVEPGIVHMFTAIEDSLVLELREENLETTEYQPYRKIVNEFIKKS